MPAGAGWGRWDEPTVAWMVFACLLVAGLAFLLWKGRGNTFFYDEWTWIESRQAGGLNAALSSYNEHLLLVPIAAYQLLIGAFGLTHYWIFRLLAALAHLAVVTAVFVYARRRVGTAALLLAAVLLVLGSGWEYILEGVNFGFTASIAFGIAALLALDAGSRRAEVTACAMLVAGLLFSEFTALFAVGIAVEVTWRDRGPRRAWIWALPLALYALWWLRYYQAPALRPDPTAVPNYVMNMAASAAAGLVAGGITTGRVVLLLIVALVIWCGITRRTFTARLAALLTVLIAFWLAVALGRAQLAPPGQPHYVYTGAVLLALVVVEACRGVRWRPWSLTVAAIMAGAALVGNLGALSGGESYLHTGAQMVRAELAALQFVRNTAPWSFTLDPVYGPQIQAGPYFAAVQAIGSTDADSPRQLLRAGERFRAAADLVLIRAGELHVSAGVAASPALGGCTRLTAADPARPADLVLPPGGLTLQALAGGALQLRARRFASGFEQTPLALPPHAGEIAVQPAADGLRLPWHLRLSGARVYRVCQLH